MAAHPTSAVPRLRRRGFSITELLVVIGIIVLLVGLLLPALSAAQNRARATATSALMEQFALACESYTQKFGFPPGVVPEAVLADNPLISGTENAILALTCRVVREEDVGSAIFNANYPATATVNGLSYGWRTIDFNGYRIKVWCLEDTTNGVWRAAVGEGPLVDGQVLPPFFAPRGSELRQVAGQVPANADGVEIPDLIDSWGAPIIYVRALRGNGPLVGDPDVAQFARASMRPYLDSTELGEEARSQESSILNASGTADANFAQVIRHPGFGAATQPLAGTAWGRFVLLSAGKDGIFFASTDGPGSSGTPVTDISTAPTGPRIVEEYDDLRRFGGS